MPKRNIWFYIAIILSFLDIIAIYISIRLIHIYRDYGDYPVPLFPFSAIVITTILLLYILNTYQFYNRRGGFRMGIRALIAVILATAFLSSILYVTKFTDYNSLFWRGNLPPAMFIMSCWAFLSRAIVCYIYSKTSWHPNWLLIGPESTCNSIISDLKEQQHSSEYSYISTEEINSLPNRLKNDDSRFLNKLRGLILCTPREKLDDKQIQLLMDMRTAGLSVFNAETFIEQYLHKVPVRTLNHSYFIFSKGFMLLHHDIALKIKRIIDLLLSLVGTIIAAPLMFLVAIGIKLTSPGKILYSQIRCGQNNRPFTIYKFRTMIDNAEKEGAQWSQENDPRITKFGNFLRKTRLDELPQLWNVFTGDMSFIGPRPERPHFVEQLEQEIPYYDLRHLVKPGITGWAQVKYPYGRSIQDAIKKLEYDLYYIKNYSIVLDVYILLRTFNTMLSKTGS